MTTDLTKHAEAILFAARQSAFIGAGQRICGLEDASAILTACAALFDAGAEAMRKAAADAASDRDLSTKASVRAIRAIDPASLRGA